MVPMQFIAGLLLAKSWPGTSNAAKDSGCRLAMQRSDDQAAISVAVIIPTYNRCGVLSRALDSVRAQTSQPAEVCVVDDGSTDGTARLLVDQYPEIQVLHQENLGVSAARNLGVKHTSAPWLAFLDSDDEWLPEKLARQMAEIESSPDTRLVHSDEIWIRNGRRINPMLKHRKSGGDIFSQSLRMCAISPSAAVMQRKLFEEVGGFDESLPACEDYDLWLRVCSRYPVNYVDMPLLKKYGGHADQLSRKHWGMDRFRIRSLAGLLDSGVLDRRTGKAAEAVQVLQEKCRILMLGASKRSNNAVLAECQAILMRLGVEDAGQA